MSNFTWVVAKDRVGLTLWICVFCLLCLWLKTASSIFLFPQPVWMLKKCLLNTSPDPQFFSDWRTSFGLDHSCIMGLKSQ